MTDPAPAPEPVEAPRSRPSKPELICGIGIGINTVAPLVLLVLTPSLLAHHVIVLEALRGGGIALVTGGAMARVGATSLLLALTAPLCRLLLTDVFYWWAGRLWGDRIAQSMTAGRPRTARWLTRIDSWVARHAVPVLSVSWFLPVPNPLIHLSCGAGGVPLALFLLGDAIGTLLWSGLFVGLGWQLGQGAVDVVHAIDHYSLIITIALVVVMVAVSVVRQRRAGAASPAP